MKKTVIVSFALLSVALHSCKKQDQSGDLAQNPINNPHITAKVYGTAPTSVLDMWNFYTTPARGRFCVRSFRLLDNGTEEIDINGNFYDAAGNKITTGAVHVGNFNLTPNINQDYEYLNANGVNSLYNTPTVFSLDPPGAAIVNGSLDIRKKITLALPVYNTTNIASNQVSVATIYKWNADAANSWGVGIVYHYDPDRPENAAPKAQGFASHMAYTKLVTDNGQYNVVASDLDDFPNGAYVNVYIGRISYDQYESNDEMYKIAGWSTVSGTYVVNK